MKNYYFRNLTREALKSSVSSFSKGVGLRLTLAGYDHTSEMVADVQKILYSTCAFLENSSDNTVKEWIDAAKRHKDDMAKILTKIINLSKLYGIQNPVRAVSRSRIIFGGDFELCEEAIQPRSFWKYYRLFSYLRFCQNSAQLIAVQSVIATVFTIYKDIGVQGPLLDQRVMEHVREMKDDSLKRSATTHHLDYVHNFLEHIDRCVALGEKPRSKSASSIVATIRLILKDGFERPLLDRDHLPKSMKSSGTSTYGKTLPAILAAAFENDITDYDYSDFDELTGYKYDQTIDINARQHVTHCCAIAHRSKDDARLIHTGCNKIQDRLHYHAEVMKVFLKRRYSIAVWDQMAAVGSICNWFFKGAKAVYSLDLHAATDTLDVSEQAICYTHLLRWMGYEEREIDILISQWLNDMRRKIHITLPNSKKKLCFDMATGQPMGLESSVGSLNLSHDLWASALEDKLELSDSYEFFGHKILGDDFCCAIKRDKKYLFPNLYKELMAELNCECNLSKGYQYNIDYSEMAIPLAEFAKNLIIDGYNITPLPINSLFKCGTVGGCYTFLNWVKDRLDVEDSKKRIPADLVISLLPEDQKSTGELLLLTSFNNVVKNLILGSKKVNYRECDLKLQLAVTLGFLKESVLMKLLASLKNDENYIPSVSDYKSFKYDWRRYAKLIIKNKDRLPNNKLLAELDNLELVATAQSIVLERIVNNFSLLIGEESDLLDLIPVLESLGSVSSESFLKLLDMISQEELEEGALSELTTPYLSSLLDAASKIFESDFNPTARRYGTATDKMVAGMDFNKLKLSIDHYLQLFKVTAEEQADTLNYLEGLYNFSVPTYWSTEIFLSATLYSDDDEEEETYNEEIWDLLEI